VLELPRGKDVTEFFECGGTVTEFLNLCDRAVAIDPDAVHALEVRWFTSTSLSTGSVSTDNGWPEPMSLGIPNPTALPRDTVPGSLGAMACAAADESEVPFEFPALLGLATVATAGQGKYVVEINPGYFEELSLWVSPAMESGTRKTTVLNRMIAPLREWEEMQFQRMQPEIKRATAQRKNQEQIIFNKRARLGRTQSDENLVAELIRLESQLPAIPTAPRVIVEDFTPEALVRLLDENEGRIGLFSDEGGFFDIAAGRYSNRPNFDAMVKAYSGSSLRVDRVSRPSVYIRKPLLSIGISPQPFVLQSLQKYPEFRHRGLLPRFLFALPESPIGYRTLKPKPIPHSVESAYEAMLRNLLDAQPDLDPDQNIQARRLRISDEAGRILHDFAVYVEVAMREGEKLCRLQDWGSRLKGTVARVAGLYHLAEGYVDDRTISPDTMGHAIATGHVLISHALSSFGLLAANPAMDNARRVVSWISKNGRTIVTANEIFSGLQWVFSTRTNLSPVLALLEDHQYIRPTILPARRGRPSQAYSVNPAILKQGGFPK
jgi:hypothetical protein